MLENKENYKAAKKAFCDKTTSTYYKFLISH